MHRNSVLHLSLFVPWEKFQSEPADADIPRLWQSFAERLSDRLAPMFEISLRYVIRQKTLGPIRNCED